MIEETRHGQNRGKTQVGAGRVLLCQQSKSGFAPIVITAALAVAALLAVSVWQIMQKTQVESRATNNFAAYSANPAQGQSPNTASYAGTGESAGTESAMSSNPDGLSQMGSNVFSQLVKTYVALNKSGTYTPALGDTVANNIAANVKAQISYAPISESDLKTDTDTSYKRMLAYRSDLRVAFAPLLLNRENELAIFGRYIETHDKNSLAKLTEAAGRYRSAAENASQVRVPIDAIGYHSAIVNSLLQFAATLEQLVKYADDSMATLALLRSYNNSEKDVYASFNALASYETHKTP